MPDPSWMYRTPLSLSGETLKITYVLLLIYQLGQPFCGLLDYSFPLITYAGQEYEYEKLRLLYALFLVYCWFLLGFILELDLLSNMKDPSNPPWKVLPIIYTHLRGEDNEHSF